MQLKSGVKLLDQQEGQGAPAKHGDKVVYNLKLFLNKGDEVPLNKRQAEHLPTDVIRTVDGYRFIDHRITLGNRDAVAGIEYSLIGMKQGGYRKVRVSPHLAYRDKGLSDLVPANSVLIVELWLRRLWPADADSLSMKSGKHRRAEIKASRNRRKAERVEKKQEQTLRPFLTVPVNEKLLAPNNSYGAPDFVMRGFYVDRPFRCKDCGKNEVWTATQQKWWYEVAKGFAWSTVIRCRACRRKEQKRRDDARRVHLEGIARKKTRSA